MSKMTATEAKQNFGDLLMNAQHEPVEIIKNGKRVGVYYADAWQAFRHYKSELSLAESIKRGLADIEAGRVNSAEDVRERLRARLETKR